MEAPEKEGVEVRVVLSRKRAEDKAWMTPTRGLGGASERNLKE